MPRLAQATFLETPIASAATTDIGAINTLHVLINGTTTITSFGTRASNWKRGRFAAALTLVHNATSLILPAGRNITTAAGDTFEAVSDASGNWRVTRYTSASPGYVGLTLSANLNMTSAAANIVGPSSAASTLAIGLSTAPAADTGFLQLFGGGNNSDNSRGAYVNLYGNNHATQAGNLQLRAGTNGGIDLSGNTEVSSGSFKVSNSFIQITRSAANAELYFDRDAGFAARINVRTGISLRWRWVLANTTAEGGANAGSDFALERYSDAAALLGTPLSISRASGDITIGQNFIMAHATGATIAPNTSDGSDSKALNLAGGGAAGAVGRGAFLTLYGNENAGLGRFDMRAGDAATSCFIIGGGGAGAQLRIQNGTADGADTGILYLAAGGGVDSATRGAYITLYGNEHAAVGSWILGAGAGATASTSYLLGGSVGASGINFRNTTADGSDTGFLFATAGGNNNDPGRGAYLAMYGNEHAASPGRFILSAGDTATLVMLIGGGASATSLRIGNQTPDAADSGDLQLYAGGNNTTSTRGAYISMYGNEHATLPGRLNLVAGDTATQLNIIGGATSAPVITIRNNSADAADGGATLITGGGAATDVSRGAYLNLYGNEHAQTGNILMAAGSAGGQIKLITSTLVLAAPTTTRAPLNFLTGSAPTSPVDGDMWREDNTNTGLKIRVNGVTKTVSLV